MSTVLPWYEPPDDVAMARPFWDAVARGQLVLPRCSMCGEWQWYPEADGTDCTDGELVWQPVSTAGTVYSFTRVHRCFLPGGRDRVPYTVGLIDLDGVDGARLVAPLLDETEIGARVQARFVADGGRTLLAFGPIS